LLKVRLFIPACSVPPSNVSVPVPIEDDVPGVELLTTNMVAVVGVALAVEQTVSRATPQIVVPPE
jgi:hypothetical protein